MCKEVVKEVPKEVEVVVTATPEPVKERPKVTIEWWTDPAFVTAPRCETCKNPGDFEKQAIDEYVKDNPNVTVNLQVLDWGDLPKKVPAAIAGGAPPTSSRTISAAPPATPTRKACSST